MIELDEREVYKVGFLKDLSFYLTFRRTPVGRFEHRARNSFIYWLKRCWKRKSYWNGFLAEPSEWPEGLATCGHGWTKQRAMKKINKYCKRDLVEERYVYRGEE